MKPSRNTIQKRIIEEEISKMNHFFSAEELNERVRERDGRIGIATVYRFLSYFRKNNRLYSYSCNKRRIYSKEKKSHCHFICERTGRVIHFDVESLDFLKNRVPGEIRSFQIEVRGTCSGCGNRTDKQCYET